MNHLPVNYIITPNGITVSYQGKLETIAEGDHRFNQVKNAIKENRLQDIPNLIDIEESFKMLPNVDLVNGRVIINGKNIPDVVSDRVLAFKEQGLPFEPLVRFAEKLLDNPSFNSRQMLYKFLEHNGHPITKDGNFIAYKKVTEDFKDCHTRSIDNSIGETVSMDRQDVDDNPNNTCSHGLHVAAYNYAKDFSRGHLMLVEVDPKDVVSVPVDYDGEKMRVCRYTVKEICESILETEYYDDENHAFL